MTYQTRTGTEPGKTGKGFSNQKGFTIIELMVALTVSAIIAVLSYPSYRTLIEKRRVTSGAEQIVAFLSKAQGEAVKRNEMLSVSYDRTDGGTWCMGFTSGSASCNCSLTDSSDADACALDAELQVFNNTNLTHPDILKAIAGQDDGYFVYDPVRGVMVDHTDSVTFELESEEGNYELNVEAIATGRMRICSKSSDTKVPGFDLC